MKNNTNLLELTRTSGDTLLVNWDNVTWVTNKIELNQKITEISFLTGGTEILLCQQTAEEIKDMVAGL